jgi:hypothetical protein
MLLTAVAGVLLRTTVVSRSQATIAVPVGMEKAPAPAPVLGISYRGALVWFDPMTLRMLPGRQAPLRGHIGSWAFSAGRSVVAIARCSDTGSLPGIRFVNARAMRVLGDILLSKYTGCARSLTWLRHDRFSLWWMRPVLVVHPVDTTSWRTRLLSPEAESFAVAGGLVIAAGVQADEQAR